jgi:F-box/leucine-rich repeat protein 2/20
LFLAAHKERLQVLELDNCPNITDSTLESMKMLKVLERVDLYDCQMITKDAIKRFKVNILNICKIIK